MEELKKQNERADKKIEELKEQNAKILACLQNEEKWEFSFFNL